MSTPRRTCLGCRGEDDRDALVRLIRRPDGGGVIVDASATAAGRGAWVHSAEPCLNALQKQPGLLARAFRAPTPAGSLVADVRRELADRLRQAIAQADAEGGLVRGADLDRAILDGEVDVVLMATDADNGAFPAPPQLVVGAALATLRTGPGARSGALVGLLARPCTVPLRRQLRRWRGPG